MLRMQDVHKEAANRSSERGCCALLTVQLALLLGAAAHQFAACPAQSLQPSAVVGLDAYPGIDLAAAVLVAQ